MVNFNNQLLGEMLSIQDCLAEPDGYLAPIEAKVAEIIALLKKQGAVLP
jgi:hypothetical protein